MKRLQWVGIVSVAVMLWVPVSLVGEETSVVEIPATLDDLPQALNDSVKDVPGSLPEPVITPESRVDDRANEEAVDLGELDAVDGVSEVAEPEQEAMRSEVLDAVEGVSEVVEPEVEKDADIASIDALVQAEETAVAARDALMAERDSLVTERDSLVAERDVLLVTLKTLQDNAGESQSEIKRLQNELVSAQMANAKERFALAYNLGNIYKAARQYERAEKEFLRALDMNADDAALHYNLGILYDDNIGNYQKARQHYERFLMLAPGDPDAPNVVKWLKELELK